MPWVRELPVSDLWTISLSRCAASSGRHNAVASNVRLGSGNGLYLMDMATMNANRAQVTGGVVQCITYVEAEGVQLPRCGALFHIALLASFKLLDFS